MKEIQLRGGYVVIVDDEDFENLNQYKWGYVSNKKKSYIYASRSKKVEGKSCQILMHRLLMSAPKDKLVDHINSNTLDNRKCNLRITDKMGNLRNSKLRSDSKCKYKGIHKTRSTITEDRYNARIQISPKKRLYLGHFKTQEEAAKAYNEATIKYFGEFARLNVIEDV